MKTPRILTLLFAATTAVLAGCVAVPAGPNGQDAYQPLSTLPPGPVGGGGTLSDGAKYQVHVGN